MNTFIPAPAHLVPLPQADAGDTGISSSSILQDQKPPRVVTVSGSMQGPPSHAKIEGVSITNTLSTIPSSVKKPGVTITETMSAPPSPGNQPEKKRL